VEFKHEVDRLSCFSKFVFASVKCLSILKTPKGGRCEQETPAESRLFDPGSSFRKPLLNVNFRRIFPCPLRGDEKEIRPMTEERKLLRVLVGMLRNSEYIKESRNIQIKYYCFKMLENYQHKYIKY
jgi:hypothetical protein